MKKRSELHSFFISVIIFISINRLRFVLAIRRSVKFFFFAPNSLLFWKSSEEKKKKRGNYEVLCFSSKQRNAQHILDGEIDHVISTLEDADVSLFKWFY